MPDTMLWYTWYIGLSESSWVYRQQPFCEASGTPFVPFSENAATDLPSPPLGTSSAGFRAKNLPSNQTMPKARFQELTRQA
jgi:hypothetical protein